MKVAIVGIEQIEAGERFRVDYGNIKELVESIKSEGIIQPLAVMERADNTYLLLAGGRRLRACTEAGLKEVPVRIYDHELNTVEQRTIELAENVCRKDLDWKERAVLSRQIHDLHIQLYGEKKSTSPDAPGWSQRDTASFIGRSPASVTQDIRLAELMEVIPDLAKSKDRKEAMKKVDSVMKDMAFKTLADQIAQKKAETPEEVAKANLINSYLVYDFFAGVKEVPDQTIDIIELDPPYAIDLHELKKSEGENKLQMNGYNEIAEDQYLGFMDGVFRECSRVLKPTGWLIAWFGPDPWFDTMLKLIRRHGLEVKGIPGIWVKPQGQTMRPDVYMASTYEMFFYARKPAAQIVKPGRANTFLYQTVAPQRKTHPTERPIELIQDILSTFALPSSRVMVPFLGSGNTLLAASNLDMQAFGYELTPEFKERFTVRVQEGKLGKYASYVY